MYLPMLAEIQWDFWTQGYWYILQMDEEGSDFLGVWSSKKNTNG